MRLVQELQEPLVPLELVQVEQQVPREPLAQEYLVLLVQQVLLELVQMEQQVRPVQELQEPRVFKVPQA